MSKTLTSALSSPAGLGLGLSSNMLIGNGGTVANGGNGGAVANGGNGGTPVLHQTAR